MTKKVPEGAGVSEPLRVYIENGGKTANEGDNESPVASARSNTHKIEIMGIWVYTDLKASIAEKQRTIMYQREEIQSLKKKEILY